MKILFVCTGNTCRSPMAEALLKKKYPKAEVKSAGVYAGEGLQASNNAIEALKELNIQFEHRTQPVTEQILNWADLILTMTTQHKKILIVEYPEYQGKYYTLKEYVTDSDETTWERVKETTAEIEKKRQLFTQQNQDKYDTNTFESMLWEHLKDDLTYLRGLESNLNNYDVSDPFGGNLETYRKTLSEISRHINCLITKFED